MPGSARRAPPTQTAGRRWRARKSRWHSARARPPRCPTRSPGWPPRLRQDAAGQPYGGWQAQERLTREAALAAYTTGAAFAGYAEGRFGRLAVGQRADFLLVDRDPLMASASELRATRVLETWIGGRKVWAAPAGE